LHVLACIGYGITDIILCRFVEMTYSISSQFHAYSSFNYIEHRNLPDVGTRAQKCVDTTARTKTTELEEAYPLGGPSAFPLLCAWIKVIHSNVTMTVFLI